MIYTFLRVETVEDVVDLIALLKRGAVVGFEPIPGSLFGPVQPVIFEEADEPFELMGGANRRVRYAAADLENFIVAYQDDRRRYTHLRLETTTDVEAIRKVWHLLNFAAGRWLTRVEIARLVVILARHYGGRAEAQMPYGDDGWTDWTKGGHGHITLWHKPSEAEIGSMIRHGVTGIINGAEAKRRRPWFVGMSGPYLMPDLGFLEYDPEMAPERAYAASGQATGLGRAWDRSRGFYRLLGLRADEDATDNEIKIVFARGLSGAKLKAHMTGPHPQDDPVRPVIELPREGAASKLLGSWGKWVRVDLTPAGT